MDELIRDVACCKADIENLKTWQTTQNGAIHRVEDKADEIEGKISSLGWGIAGALALILLELIVSVTIYAQISS